MIEKQHCPYFRDIYHIPLHFFHGKNILRLTLARKCVYWVRMNNITTNTADGYKGVMDEMLCDLALNNGEYALVEIWGGVFSANIVCNDGARYKALTVQATQAFYTLNDTDDYGDFFARCMRYAWNGDGGSCHTLVNAFTVLTRHAIIQAVLDGALMAA